jgi:hypothetical protein
MLATVTIIHDNSARVNITLRFNKSSVLIVEAAAGKDNDSGISSKQNYRKSVRDEPVDEYLTDMNGYIG